MIKCSKCKKRKRLSNSAYCAICKNEIQNEGYQRRKKQQEQLKENYKEAVELLKWIKQGINEFWEHEKSDAIKTIKNKLNECNLLKGD
jgi:hypothetical protein